MIEQQDLNNIVEKHQKLVYHLIYRIVSDRSVADDLFQEVFLNIFKSLPDFKGNSKLSTWIASLTINTCYTHFKRQKRDSRTYSLENFMDETAGIADSGPSISEKMERQEINEALADALGKMSMKYRIPIVLFYLEGHSYIEISEILEIPMGTVKTHLFRGLKQLKTIMGGGINEFLQAR